MKGTQFWSSADNACALPGCEATAITVTKPVTVVVRSQSGEPYPNLPVYVFTGAAYTGYSGTTDANGAAVFTLPQGEYRFRADLNGTQFWSGDTDTCVLPGCETAAVTLPGGTGESNVTIQYEYDALNRMTAARYSNGIAFAYTYDAAGNVLEYTATLNGQTKTTSYTYDEANQLLTATQEGVTWHYEYDGNGSLIQTTPGEDVANGAKRYTSNTASSLTNGETHIGTSWKMQAEMAYDGLGNRLAMTGYADGQSVTTTYVADSGQTLLASAGEMTTAYLYGLGVIGEQTDAWAYSLPDGTNTARQLVNGSGKVTLVSSYTPWGDILSVNGTGNFTFGYFGGIMDVNTGLVYIGSGQYYDPATGRFLNRDTRSGQTNPYVPWKADPAGAMIAPLLLLALAYGRKKNRGKWDNLIILLVLCGTIGMSLSACNPVPPQPPSQSPTAPPAPSTTPSPTPTETQPSSTPRPAASPTVSVSLSATIICTGTLTSTPMPTPTPTVTPGVSEYGITFEGSWNEDQKASILAAVSAVGAKLSTFLGSITNASAFVAVYGSPLYFVKGGSGGACQAGYQRVVCYANAELNDRFFVHELGHVLQHSIDGVNSRQPTPTPTKGPYYDLEKAAIKDGDGNWVTGTHTEYGGQFERTIRGYISDGIPDMYHGPNNFDNWNSNLDYTARNEDFADMFMNWVFNSFDYRNKAKGAGILRYNWVQDHMQSWIFLATR
jgi:RHS repeat-associated protein